MKRNTIILIAVLILGALTVYLVMNSGKGSVARELRDFAYADTAGIDRIFLADKTGKQVTLTRQENNTWLVNDTFLARPDGIDNILRVLKNLSVREPVGEKAREGVIKKLITGSIKCEFYADEEMVRLFYVGGETPDMLGTYMLLADPETQENSSEPFVMEIKGQNGYLTPYFSPDHREWREKSVFRYHVPDIRSVRVEHVGFPDESFIVTQSPQMTYELQTLSGMPITFDTLQCKQFLSYFIRLNFVEFANDFPKKDSVLASNPAHIITVQDASGQKNTVKFYLKSGGKDYIGTDSLEAQKAKYDVDNMHASINEGKDFVLVQYFVFGKLLQTPAYFSHQLTP